MTRAVLTPRAVWWRARAPVGLSKLCQLLALSAWHGIAQERSAGSSIKQISAPCAWRESPEPTPGQRASSRCNASAGSAGTINPSCFIGRFPAYLKIIGRKPAYRTSVVYLASS